MLPNKQRMPSITNRALYSVDMIQISFQHALSGEHLGNPLFVLSPHMMNTFCILFEAFKKMMENLICDRINMESNVVGKYLFGAQAFF